MNKAVSKEVLLTSDDIRHWQEELKKWEATKANAESRIAEFRAKLEAAALLFGASFPLIVPVDAGDGEQESLTDATKRILTGFAKPVLHHEIQAELRKTPRFQEMLDKNNGAYYYTMIRRLVDRGDIKRVGKKFRLVHKDEAPAE